CFLEHAEQTHTEQIGRIVQPCANMSHILFSSSEAQTLHVNLNRGSGRQGQTLFQLAPGRDE
ncbi:hypothetical protein, partial [Salinibacter ruber]|uniref:hypothetical protein n=1 Tax=Salinibacter ruber TaxID=146919 RepID=UPI0020749D85